MSMLKEAFEAGKFGVTAEMAPPKGYDFSEQLEAAKLLNGKVHGVNVTDMQSASLKASSLGLCATVWPSWAIFCPQRPSASTRCWL